MRRTVNPKKPVRGEAGILSWILTVLMIGTLPIIGIVLLLMKLSGNDVLGRLFSSFIEKKDDGSANYASKRVGQAPQPRYASQSRSRQDNQPADSASSPQSVPKSQTQTAHTGYQVRTEVPRRSQPAAAPQPAPPKAEQAKKGKEKNDNPAQAPVSKGRSLLMVFGWLLLLLGFTAMFSPLDAGHVWQAIQWISVGLAGAGMIFASWFKGRKESSYLKCVRVVGNRSVIDLNTLASALGRKPRDMERDLDDMVERGYFGDAAFYDRERDILIISPDKAEGELKKAVRFSTEGKDKYELLLLELDRVILRLKDEEMLQKAATIRELAAAIFQTVRENPEKQSRITSFLNYYFPTTLKLMENYADFAAQTYQGENVSKSKERIEGAADTIIDAYRRQLDSLYLSESLDVDSDIDVLETMLKRDGLAESDFSQSQAGLM